MALRILLADDHEIVRRGLRALLEKHEGWEVCGEASDGREAVEKALQLKPDVVIVDIGMTNPSTFSKAILARSKSWLVSALESSAHAPGIPSKLLP